MGYGILPVTLLKSLWLNGITYQRSILLARVYVIGTLFHRLCIRDRLPIERLATMRANDESGFSRPVCAIDAPLTCPVGTKLEAVFWFQVDHAFDQCEFRSPSIGKENDWLDDPLIPRSLCLGRKIWCWHYLLYFLLSLEISWYATGVP